MRQRQPDYRIVFKKLAEATAQLGYGATPSEGDLSLEEAQEIEELRQIALEVEDPQPQSYTTT